jgi:hypothetical protein
MENATKMIPAPFGELIFDQVALSEQVGVINSARMMKILRQLRKGPTGEGKLAAACSERMFYPEWSQFINLLLQWKWIKAEPTGHAASKELSLAPLGEEFLASRLDPKPKPVESEE